jgi:hypothetical protein
MVVVPVMDVGDALETGSETARDFFLPDKPASPDVRASRRVEDAVIGEVGHDRVEIVSVECAEDLAEGLELGVVRH